MAESASKTGVLVAVHERAFKPFKAKDGKEVPGGVTRLAFVVERFTDEPLKIVVRDAGLFSDLRELGQGASVLVNYDLMPRATGNGFAENQRILTSFSAADAAAVTAGRVGAAK